MRSRHLISNTKYATGRQILFPFTKMRYPENSFEELVKCSETSSPQTFSFNDNTPRYNIQWQLSQNFNFSFMLLPTNFTNILVAMVMTQYPSISLWFVCHELNISLWMLGNWFMSSGIFIFMSFRRFEWTSLIPHNNGMMSITLRKCAWPSSERTEFKIQIQNHLLSHHKYISTGRIQPWPNYKFSPIIQIWCNCILFNIIQILINWSLKKLEQLERLRSEKPPAAPWLPILVIHIRS